MNPQSTPILNTEQSTLYDQDYYLWLATTINQLKQGKLTEVDLYNLIEELEDMGRSEKRALKSNLIIVLMHLLKYWYQPQLRSNSWLFTIKEHRRRLKEDIKTSPSLNRYLTDIFEDCYQDARDLAATETGLNLETFPIDCPFTLEKILDSNYLPD